MYKRTPQSNPQSIGLNAWKIVIHVFLKQEKNLRTQRYEKSLIHDFQNKRKKNKKLTHAWFLQGRTNK